MPRLFIAIETPSDLAATLLGWVPGHRGIRPTPAAQLHLTLRFLGDQDADAAGRIGLALRAVALPAPILQVDGVGRFRGRQGAILWAGLAPFPLLQDLFAEIGAALAREGVAPDPRPFRPHLTLARCRTGVPEAVLRDWLAAHRTQTLPAWRAERFVLYESVLGHEGARHIAREVRALD